MSARTFSVVIPTFNRSRFVPLAIESVLRQSFNDCEIIVVDDGSTDDTAQAVQPYRGRITYLRQENRGVSAARNAGIRAAGGEWVAFLDSDDEWVESYLERQKDLITRYPQVVGSVCNAVAEAADGSKTGNFEYHGFLPLFDGKPDVLLDKPFDTVISRHLFTLQSSVFRRKPLLRTRLFDESLTIAEDLDVIAQMALKGPFVLCREVGARIIRRQEEMVSLGAQYLHSGIRTRSSWAQVYERFLAADGLSSIELRAVRRRYASNQRALGNLYLKSDAIAKARTVYGQAWRLDHSPASLLRYLFSLMPASAGRMLLHKEGNVVPGVE